MSFRTFPTAAFAPAETGPTFARHALASGRDGRSPGGSGLRGRIVMAKKSDEGVYKIVEVVGVSEISWEDAGKKAVQTAAKSLRDLRIAEVMKMDMKVDNGK